jgi:DNA-binding SARP family transcriptional activator/tetratricopeptide (TPR) repeat protein
MWYRILGPLSVGAGDRPVPLTAPRDRIVLAMLLLHAGRVVGVDALIEAVWDDDPPVTARGQLQNCISRLRRVLPAAAIRSDPAGYRIDPPADRLDSLVFARLAADGRRDKDPAALRRALDLWRGEALSGIDSEAVRRTALVWNEQYVQVCEDWAELESVAGRHRELIAPLSEMVERFPSRERLRGRLIQALAGAGRPADALAEFRRFRAWLSEELGIEPGPALQELHRQLLAGETPPDAPAPEPAVVRSLPRTVADFTGRAGLVARLRGRIDGPGPVVLALDGMAGSGKTTLALHLATLVGDRFPDAHLYVDLHGHSDREPLEPSAALLSLLRRLGVEKIPDDGEERAARWRDEMAKRRALVVLDNAASSAQVIDLLPAAADSLVLVTSRRRLLGLDGVHPESLPVFDEAEAVALLARIAGDRVRAEASATADLVRRCGGLPLAIRLAGSRLAHRPRWQVADLVQRFGSAALPELTAEKRTVAGAFALSFGQLPAPAQRLFRLLGLHPGLLDVAAAAALGERTPADAADLLDDLVDVHLLEEPEPGVFRMHDLLHEYAAALAAELGEEDRREALRRLLDLEIGAALGTLDATRRRSVLRKLGLTELPSADLVAIVADPGRRLDRAHSHLYALVEAAIEAGLPEYSWRLARASWWRLYVSGYTDDSRAMLLRARDEARRVGDVEAQAICANCLAAISFRRARFAEAQALLQEAIRARRMLGDRLGLSDNLVNLGGIYLLTDRFVEATEVLREASALNQQGRWDDLNAMVLLDGLSAALSGLGSYDEALRTQRRRLMGLLPGRDPVGIVQSLVRLVSIRRRAGLITAARAERTLRIVLRQALRIRYLEGAAEVRLLLGDVLRELGRHDEAVEQLEQALVLFDRVDDRRFRPVVLNTLATVRRETGDPAAAARTHRQALELATAAAQPFQAARAHLGLGDCDPDPDSARASWRTAERIFTELRVPERHDAAARLHGT